MALLADAATGAFDLVLAEDQDRITRDLEDSAAIFKRLSFHDVELFTLANGRVDWLQIGFKGTMDQTELKKLGEKVRRGQRGNLSRGRVPGGLCYGYDIVRAFDDRGRVDAGRRRINPDQAAIVRRIMEEYAAGRSPRQIARDLNAEGIKSPRGGEWRASAIIGSRSRQVGILHNPIYTGRFVYGRVAGRRHPDTRNRVWRATGDGDREVYEIPELRIVSDDLWQSVQAARESRAAQPLTKRRRPRRLLSGLVKCGRCGGNFTNFANDRLSCSRAREAGTCSSTTVITAAELEHRVLAGLRDQLLSPEAVSLMVREYHLERERILRDSGRTRAQLERRLAQARAAVERLVAAIADGGGAFPELREALAQKSAERDSIARELAEVQAPTTIALHPQIADAYRVRIERLTAGDVSLLSDAQKAEIRELVDAIYVTAGDVAGEKKVELVGSLEAAIALASGAPPPKRGTLSISVVAGDRIRRNRQRRSIMA
jgi:DNA invertase Pin-like site-specific DNA recombinase